MNKSVTVKELLKFLPGERIEKIVCFDLIDSTNTYLKNKKYSPDGTVIIANKQTNGRGRLGRNFISESNQGIFLSYLKKLDSLTDCGELTAKIAVSVCDAIENVCKFRPQIKWVNDLLINNKKICGILTELVFDEKKSPIAIIGIGVNVNSCPSELTDIASSLSVELGTEFSASELTAEIIKQIDGFQSKNYYFKKYKTDCITIGKNVNVIQNGNIRKGFAESLNEDFSVNIRFGDGHTEKISYGEISLKQSE